MAEPWLYIVFNRVAAALPHPYTSETGCFLHPGYGGLTLHHLLQTGAMPQRAYRALSIPGFIAARLTGRCTTDETFAASWGIWDMHKNRWHTALLEDLGFLRSCCRIGCLPAPTLDR